MVFKSDTLAYGSQGLVLIPILFKEASLAGLKIGFKHLRLNRLEAAINLDNKISIKLAKAIGMKSEGVKKRYWFEYGKWTDHLIYVSTPEDIGLAAKKPYVAKK